MSQEIQSLLSKYQTNNTDLVKLMANDFLPYITVGAGTSAAVQMGVASPGDLILTTAGNPVKLCGKKEKVDAILCLSRAKAMGTQPDIRVSTDPNSALFKELVALAGEKDSGAMYGPEYLVYLPKDNKFVAFHLASKTARKMTPVFQEFLGKSVQLFTKEISTQRYKWFGPMIEESVTPHTTPSEADLAEAVEKFNKGGGVAAATDSDTTTSERAR